MKVFLSFLQDGVSIATEKDTSLSLKKKHYGEFKRELSYGGFLESSSVQCSLGDGGVTVTAKSDGKTEEGEGEEGEGEGVKILQIADDMLFEACGGRTAHKYVCMYVCMYVNDLHFRGARHGLTLSGKLARIQQQEAAEANGPQVEIKGSKVTTKTATSRSHEEKKRKEKKRFRDDTDKDRTQKSKTKKLKMKNQ